MKRVLAWMLLLVMVLGMFAGCKPQEDPTPTTEPVTTAPQGEQSGVQGPGAQDAMDYLKSLYQEDGTETPVDYNRYGIIRVGGIEFKIEWSVDVAEDFVKVVVNEDGTVTIDINEQCEEATPYALTATITDENGNVATHTWNHILPKAQDMVEIVKAAYALGKGESLPYQSRLIGKIVSIDAIWTDEYQNITVTIEVEGAEDMPIKCYRMKGNDNTITVIKDLKVGNIITVLGILKNYEGTIEFDAGCILEKVEKGDAVDAPTDPGKILKAAYALKQDEALPYQATLTGRVIEIDSPYDPNYGNISVIIEVEGYEKYPMLCYRLKGTGVEDIAIDDLITVTGIIKNYRGTIEYDAGCMMTERVSGGGVAQKPSSDAAKILADAAKLSAGEKLPYRATLTGEIYSVDNAYDPNYGNVTVTIKVNGVKIQCYRMVGDGIDQIRETDTITVTGVIENYNGKLEFGAKCNLDSWEKGPRNVNYGPVDEDVAYRLYINQTGVNKTVYFNGEFKSNRLQTTAIGSEGADVYAERISGRGLRFFYMDGETKTYIEIEEFTNDEGKQRGGLRVTTEPSCYWVYNSECGVYIVNLPTAGKYFMGTYGTYETISASWIGYIDGSYSGGSTQYVAKFIEADQVQDVEPEPTEPTEPSETLPVVTDTLENGDRVVIYAPAYNKALSADKVNTGSYYNKGIDITVANGEVSGYGDAEIWTVVKNADGTYSFANGGKNIGLAADYSSMNLGAIHDDWTLISLGDGLYNIKNVGRGNFIEWYDEKGNWSTYNSSYAATDGQFQLSFYIIGEGILGDETVEPEVTEPEVTEPEVTEPEVTEPSVSVALDNGDKVVIFAPAYNKALSADKVNTGSYYNKGVDITVANGEVSGYGDAEIWTVVKNADGTYSFANGGKNIGLAADYSSMNLGAIHDDWTLISLGDGLYNIKNVGRGNFIEWYDEKGNWSTYNSSYAATDGQFQLSFYIIGEGILGDETVEPEVTEPEVTEPEVTEPEVTEPTVSGNGYIKVTSEAEFTSGKYVMIVSSGYAPGVFDNGWLSAVQPVVSGNVVTDTKDAVWTITVNGDSVTFTDANGVTIKPKGGNNNGVLEGSYNWAWSFENGTFKFAGTGSDTVVLASNATTTGQFPGNHRFRGYKTTTVSSQASNYPCAFTLYKLSEGTGVEPEVTEPEVTVPEATEPEATNPGSSEPAIYPFIIVAEDAGVAMTTVSQDKTYGYLPKTDVTVVDGVLNGITADNVFYMVTIEEGEDYAIVYMVDYYGRVLYMTGTFNSCNFSNEIPAEGAEWKLTLTEDGRIYITNILKDKTFGYSSEFSSFGVYPDASKHTALLFVPVEITEEDPDATEPEVTEPEATEPEATEPVAGSSVTYTFANYTAGTAYGAEEEHYLDENMTVFTYECYFTKQLRLYQDDKGDGRAVFTSSKAITSVVINAGYRVADLEVYGSVDGENWVLIDTISHPTKDAYADYSVQFPADAQYKYMKLDADGGQIRIPYITFNFAG